MTRPSICTGPARALRAGRAGVECGLELGCQQLMQRGSLQVSPRSVSYRTDQEYEASDREFRQTELNMDKDDSISPTLPTFDMRTRVSRDQTEIRAPSPSSSSTSASSSSLGSMPIILEMRPGETILERHDDAMQRENSFGSSSKDPRGGAAAGRSSRYRSRPASLATTLRPRRASTGAGLSDWISMYDPQTPTAIVDLERMASGFPLIPQGVDEEEDVEDGLSGGTSRVTGLPRGLDHDRLDSITSWQRDCCELKRFPSECLIIGEIPPVTRASLFLPVAMSRSLCCCHLGDSRRSSET